MRDLTDQLLSQFMDREVPKAFMSQIEEAITSDSRSADTVERMKRLSSLLHENEIVDIHERQVRSLDEIRRRLTVQTRLGFWARWRQIHVPLPAAAAAAVAVVALTALLVWAVIPRSQGSATDLVTQGKGVDVTIRVDNAEMEQVLQWLVDKEMLDEVSIQLPEQTWSIVGEPVLLKPENLPKGFTE